MEEQENKMVDTWIQQLYPVVNHTRNLEEQTRRWRGKKKQDDRYQDSTALSLQLASTQGIWRGKIERRWYLDSKSLLPLHIASTQGVWNLQKKKKEGMTPGFACNFLLFVCKTSSIKHSNPLGNFCEELNWRNFTSYLPVMATKEWANFCLLVLTGTYYRGSMPALAVKTLLIQILHPRHWEALPSSLTNFTIVVKANINWKIRAW